MGWKETTADCSWAAGSPVLADLKGLFFSLTVIFCGHQCVCNNQQQPGSWEDMSGAALPV